MSWTGNGESFTGSVMTTFCRSTVTDGMTFSPTRIPLFEFQILFLGDLAVALQRVGDEPGELFRRVAGGLDALRAETLEHLGTFSCGPHRLVEPVDDRARRARRRHQAEPTGRFGRRQAGLDQGRHLRQARSEEHTSELQSRENLVCR